MTQHPTTHRIRPRRGMTLTLVVSLLLGVIAVTGNSTRADALPDSTETTEALPDSASCVFAAGLLAGSAYVAVKAPPAGFWAIVITSGAAIDDLASVVQRCGAWFTNPLGQVIPVPRGDPTVQIRGHGGCMQCLSGYGPGYGPIRH